MTVCVSLPSGVKSVKDKMKLHIATLFVTLKLKDIKGSFVKNVKKITAKDVFFVLAICSLAGATIKLFKQCTRMKSEINDLRAEMARNFKMVNNQGKSIVDLRNKCVGVEATTIMQQMMMKAHLGEDY